MNKAIALTLAIASSAAFAETIVSMHSVDEKGIATSVGQVAISETKYGLVFSPTLQGLSPGLHGFHVHQNASCDPKEIGGKMVAAGAAGGHYDPLASNVHGTPWGEGHLGDLPALHVDASGSASQPVLAPRLKLSDLGGRALMIHAGGDNHSDHPAALGGGGARIACGVIK